MCFQPGNLLYEMFYICRIMCNVPVLGTVRLYDVLHPNAAVPRPSLDPDVAIFAPARAPGVTDQPVGEGSTTIDQL